MEYKGDIIHPIWLIKTLPLFLTLLGLTIYQFFSSPNFNIETIAFLVIFTVPTIFIILKKSKFSLFFEESLLRVNQLTNNVSIPYDKILKIFIRQSPVDRVLGVKSLIIQFDIPQEQEKAEIKAFGHSFTRIPGLELPGTYGNLLTIPGLIPEKAEELALKFQQTNTSRAPEVIRMGIGYPYRNQMFRAGYFFSIGGAIIILIWFALSALAYIYINYL